MFRSPINKNGDIRIVEVIKYTLLIAFFSYGYSYGVHQIQISVSLGISTSFVIAIAFMLILSLVALYEGLHILRRLSTPIITRIHSTRLNIQFCVEKSISFLHNTYCQTEKKLIKLCVIRC